MEPLGEVEDLLGKAESVTRHLEALEARAGIGGSSLLSKSPSRSPGARQSPAGKSIQTSNMYMPKNYEIVPSEEKKEQEGVEEEVQEESVEEEAEEETNESDLFDLPNDAYAFIFLAPIGTQGFFFGFYVFALKISLFSLLAIDAFEALKVINHDETSKIVLATQCLILPVAVAMQEDLRSTYTLLSNVKYSSLVLEFHPDATKFKYYLSTILRGMDGMYSLCINFVVLLMADTVAALFLNFAALEFL